MRRREKVSADPDGSGEVFTDHELRVDAAMVAQRLRIFNGAPIDGPEVGEAGDVALARVLAAADAAGLDRLARVYLDRVRVNRRHWRRWRESARA